MSSVGKRIAEWTAQGEFIGLARGECRWPVGRSTPQDMSLQRFCAKPCEGTYCETHNELRLAATSAPRR